MKIHQKTGTPPHSQHLQLRSGGALFYEIPPNRESDRKLGYYSLPLGANVHCIDVDPNSSSANGAYEDTSLVKKYVMTDEEYDKRKGTLRDWGRKEKERNPSFTLRRHAREHAELVEARRLYKESGELKKGFELDESTGTILRRPDGDGDNLKGREEDKAVASDESEHGWESVQHLALHSRCQVQPGSRRGEIAFIGRIDELGGGGQWVGVILDEPVGKTDGTVQSSGVRYFDAPGPKRGGFFRGKNVESGDFPEVDILADLEDSEDEL